MRRDAFRRERAVESRQNRGGTVCQLQVSVYHVSMRSNVPAVTDNTAQRRSESSVVRSVSRQHITHTTHRQDDRSRGSRVERKHTRTRQCRRLRSPPRTERARGESRLLMPLRRCVSWRPPSCSARDDAPSITRHTEAEGNSSAIFVPSPALCSGRDVPETQTPRALRRIPA